jgi:glutamate racemase
VDHRVVACVDGVCRPLKEAGVDTVILGCTHYPLVRPVLQRALGRGVSIITSGQAIADEVDAKLREAGLAQDEGRRGRYEFMATGDPEEFRRLGTRFLQLPIGTVEAAHPARRAA